MEQDQAFVEYVVRAIVNNPDDVKATRTIDERGVLITLDVNPADMGYVIGRQGQTARALRTLLKIVGAKNNARVNLKVSEPEGSTRGYRSNDRSNDRSHDRSHDNRSHDRSNDRPSVPTDIDVSAVDNLNI